MEIIAYIYANLNCKALQRLRCLTFGLSLQGFRPTTDVQNFHLGLQSILCSWVIYT